MAPIKIAGQVERVVPLMHFERFLTWFGPVIPKKKEGTALLETIKELLSKPWFHGSIDANQASNRILQSNKSNGFLVRFSTTSKCYTISYYYKKKMLHTKCPVGGRFILLSSPSPLVLETRSVIRYVESFKKRCGLSAVKQNRVFGPLFEKEKNIQTSAYMSDGRETEEEFDSDDEGDNLLITTQGSTMKELGLSMSSNVSTRHI